jgi:hypothetical protein
VNEKSNRFGEPKGAFLTGASGPMAAGSTGGTGGNRLAPPAADCATIPCRFEPGLFWAFVDVWLGPARPPRSVRRSATSIRGIAWPN